MELVILIFVNLLLAFTLYVVFSFKLNRLIKHKQQSPFVPDLEKNIELTVQFINSSLRLMEQKTKAFYQMLRRAEEIRSQLQKEEKPSFTSKAETKNLTKNKEKRTNFRSEISAITEYGIQREDPTMKKKVNFALLEKESKKEDLALSRVMQALPPDRVEITMPPTSLDSAYLLGASMEHQKALEKKRSLQSSDFLSKSSQPKVSAGNGGMTNTEPSQSNLSWLISQILSMKEKLQTKTREPVHLKLEDSLSSAQIASQRTPHLKEVLHFDLDSQHTEESPLPLKEENFIREKERLSSIENTQQKQQSTILRNSPPPIANLGLRLPKDMEKRKNLIRDLLAKDYNKEDISSATGIAMAELNFIEALPNYTSAKPRRRSHSKSARI